MKSHCPAYGGNTGYGIIIGAYYMVLQKGIGYNKEIFYIKTNKNNLIYRLDINNLIYRYLKFKLFVKLSLNIMI